MIVNITKVMANCDGVQLDTALPVSLIARVDTENAEKIKYALGENFSQAINYRGSGRQADILSWREGKANDILAPTAARFALYEHESFPAGQILEAQFASMNDVNTFFQKLGDAKIIANPAITAKQDATKIFDLTEQLLAVGKKQDRSVSG